jgi:hypothetical protein
MEAPIKAGYMEELRFGKRQQWAVAAASIALIAGAFHVADGAKPLASWEKRAVSMLDCSGWRHRIDFELAKPSRQYTQGSRPI